MAQGPTIHDLPAAPKGNGWGNTPRLALWDGIQREMNSSGICRSPSDMPWNGLRLQTLLAGRTKSISTILKRKILKTETEFYLLKEALISEHAPISSKQRKLAESMLANYEQKLGRAV